MHRGLFYLVLQSHNCGLSFQNGYEMSLYPCEIRSNKKCF